MAAVFCTLVLSSMLIYALCCLECCCVIIHARLPTILYALTSLPLHVAMDGHAFTPPVHMLILYVLCFLTVCKLSWLDIVT